MKHAADDLLQKKSKELIPVLTACTTPRPLCGTGRRGCNTGQRYRLHGGNGLFQHTRCHDGAHGLSHRRRTARRT